jgi:hypothetical protein
MASIMQMAFGSRLCFGLRCFALQQRNGYIFLKEKDKKERQSCCGVAILSSFLEKIVRLDRVKKKVRYFSAYYFFQNPCGLSFTGF